MATSAVSAAAAAGPHPPATPLRTINRGHNFMRHTTTHHRTAAALSGKRKSAVELLQETKSLYVKSNTVLDRKQQLITSSGGGALSHHTHHHHHHHHGDRRTKDRDSMGACTPMPPPKSPRLVNCNAPQRHSPPAHSDRTEFQTKLRRLLNADSKENLLDVAQDTTMMKSLPPLPLPPSLSTPTSPISSLDHMSMTSVILPPPKSFCSRRSSLSSSQSQNSLLRTTMAGTLRAAAPPNPTANARSAAGDPLLRSSSVSVWSHHKSLPDLHRAATVGPAGASLVDATNIVSTSTSSSDNSDDNPTSLCRYALYSASTGSDGSKSDGGGEEKRGGKRCSSRQRTGSSGTSANNNDSGCGGIGYDAMSVCSTQRQRRRSQRGASRSERGAGTSVGSWRSLSDEESTSGGGGGGSDYNESGHHRFSGSSNLVDMVFGSPVKSCASYTPSLRTSSVRYSRVRCDTDWSSTAVDGGPTTPDDVDGGDMSVIMSTNTARLDNNDNNSCDDPAVRWRPILRSKSDVGGRRYEARTAPADSPPSPDTDHLEAFFQQLGLDTAEYSMLVGRGGNVESEGGLGSNQTSPVFFSDASTVDSTELCAAKLRRNINSPSPNVVAGSGANPVRDEPEADHPVDLPSVVERNARIIKWLCNCRKAANVQQSSNVRHTTMS